MPRLIFKCPYLKGTGATAAKRKNYVLYIATREGAQQVESERADWPATKKQQKLVEQLLRDFPESQDLFEYTDYTAAPTRANASELITRMLEDNMDAVIDRKGYLNYIALRPRAERMDSHALFSDSRSPLVLSQVATEVAEHPGNVWLPIFSLRREDAARLGYDSASHWQALLSSHAPDIAKAMKIPWEQFRWYAAFHNEGHHPHVHMVVYSADGRSGFLTKDGISAIKHDLAQEMFRQELTEIYQEQTMRRNQLTAKSRERMEQLLREIETGTASSPRLEQLTMLLAQQLQTVKGKKQYGYLKPQLKALVDEVVDELARDPRIEEAYALWYQLRKEALRTYRDDLPERPPLSHQKELKQIRNMVIQETLHMGQMELPREEPEEADEELPRDLDQLTVKAKAGDPDAQYLLGRRYRDGDSVDRDILQAVIWFTQAAEQGNSKAAYAMGRLYLAGGEVPPDREKAAEYLSISAQQGNENARRLLEHLETRPAPTAAHCATQLLYHLSRIFRAQTPELQTKLRVEVDSKLRRRIREKKIAMGHKPDDHEQKM